MIIKNIKINNFGKLENKEIEFNKKLNLIYGENESGKTTILKFIQSMFYGASKNKNGKNITDYEKYKSWNNGEYSGKIKYTLDNGENYEVFREFDKKNPKIYNEKLEDISKNFNIDKTKGNQFFYDQTKVDEELFLSTIVAEQREVELDEKKQNVLLQKITNIVGTGEDNTSFNKTINKLNKKLLEEVGTERSSDRPINNAENRIKEIENEKEEILIYADKKYSIEEENKKIIEEINKSENELEIIKNIKKIKEAENIEKEKIKINKNIEEENNKKIKNIQEKINELEIEKNKKENKTKNKKNHTTLILLIIFLILEIIIWKFTTNVITIISGIIFISILLINIIRIQKNRKNIIKEIKQKEQQINQNINQLKNEIEILQNNNEEYINNTKQIEEKIKKETNEKIEKIKTKDNENEINKMLQKNNIENEYDNQQAKLNNLKLELHKLELEKENILPKLENLSSLEEELSNIEEKYEELKNTSKSINLAKEYLELAYEKMKENVTPKFTKNLSENINKITSGKYKNVKFNDEKGLIVEIENGNYISAENLSIGTIEQLYLSLRLALVDEISEETMPIILDEAFAYYDKTRLEKILKYLIEETKNRQILIFTCTKREQEILEELKIEYNLIKI